MMKNTIRVERARMNISQAELARMVGVSRQTIHKIETGQFAPSTLLALKMAHIFKINTEELFNLEEVDYETIYYDNFVKV